MDQHNSLSANRRVPTELESNLIPDLNGLKILIVDDCEENQFLFSHLLQRKGAVISTSFNGQDGVEKVINEHFDIILMDIQMPIMDGYVALACLKKLGLSVPVLAVTATNSTEEKQKIAEAGFSGYISKPIDKDLMLKTIFNVAHKKHEEIYGS